MNANTLTVADSTELEKQTAYVEGLKRQNFDYSFAVSNTHFIESMRAIHGSLPLLTRASQITVLDGAAHEDRLDARHLPRVDLRAWLQRRGVQAEFRTFAPKNEVGPAILAAARDLQADMLVLGAWGHSRIAELVLGGATRYLFQHSDVPLFVAH